MSTWPNSLSAFAAIASTWSFRAMSAMTASAFTPSARASRTTESASASFERALTTTWAPSAASFNTVARPMLRPEPVTRAIFPSSLPMSHLHDDVREVEGIRTPWQRQTGPFGRLSPEQREIDHVQPAEHAVDDCPQDRVVGRIGYRDRQ